ncbi:MAG: gamma subclass chorismate mutase AroQ [Planctomycetaceae bacterium]|nr:gamma subclass chorismate mutase AroQ [Planctomycetaceae bacterium]
MVCALIVGCTEAPATQPTAPSDQAKADDYAVELHTAIWNRLALMPAVAQNKFHHQRPISDRGREAELVDQFRLQAANRGIQPDFAEKVIRAQIEASKLIQTELHAQWQDHPPSEDTLLRDLVQDLRPSIDLATERLLAALQLLGTVPQENTRAIEHAYARRSPLPPHVPEKAWDVAWAPLRDAPKDFVLSREALKRASSFRSALPENQPLLPEFVPESEQ